MSEIVIELSEDTARTLENIFGADDPRQLAKVVDIDPDQFKDFLQEANIEIDQELEKFIKGLQKKFEGAGEKYKAKAAASAAMLSTGRMTQSEIIDRLAEKSGLKKSEVKEFFNKLADLATSQVKNKGEFTLPGFGKFVKTKRKAREGRNPTTGEAIKIPAKTTVKFRAGKSLKGAVGGK